MICCNALSFLFNLTLTPLLTKEREFKPACGRQGRGYFGVPKYMIKKGITINT